MQINCKKSFILKRRLEIMLHIWLKYLSFAMAVFSLSFIIIYRSVLISLDDWSALADTKLEMQLLAALLPSLAISLNGLALGIRKRK